LTDARTLASPNIVIILVGNKKDLETEREVTFLEASRFAQENIVAMHPCFILLFVDINFTLNRRQPEGYMIENLCIRDSQVLLNLPDMKKSRMGGL
jgi:GTPase SAR1 family protein